MENKLKNKILDKASNILDCKKEDIIFTDEELEDKEEIGKILDEIEQNFECECDDNYFFWDTQSFANTKTHTLYCSGNCKKEKKYLQSDWQTIDNNGFISSSCCLQNLDDKILYSSETCRIFDDAKEEYVYFTCYIVNETDYYVYIHK
jgi:hypothetical protein